MDPILDSSAATAFAIGRQKDAAGKEKIAMVFAAGTIQVVALLSPENAETVAEQLINEATSMRTGLSLPIPGKLVTGS